MNGVFKLAGLVWVVFWGLVFLHIQVFVFKAFTSAKSCGSSMTSSKQCPFKAAKHFLEQPSALIANSLFAFNGISSSAAFSARANEIVRTMNSEDWKRFHHLHDAKNQYSSHGDKHGNGYAQCHFTGMTLRATRMSSSSAFPSLDSAYSCSSLDPSSLALIPSPAASYYDPGTLDPPPISLEEAAVLNNAVTEQTTKREKRVSENSEVIVVGLSHHNAKVEVREKLAIPEEKWNEISRYLVKNYDSIEEASILSTCNRFEIYLTSSNPYQLMKDVMSFLIERSNNALDQETLRDSLFMLQGEDAIWHLMKVAAGLDSIVVGEAQILAQVKKCHQRGIEKLDPTEVEGESVAVDKKGPAGKILGALLSTAVKAGRRVRKETEISRGSVSISSAAIEFTMGKLPDIPGFPTTDLRDSSIAVIGAGKMTRLLLKHLQAKGMTSVTVINRSMERINELQKEFQGKLQINAKLMNEGVTNAIADADIVFTSTASEDPILNPEPLAAMMKEKRSKGSPLFLVDISVPRNVHPDCSSIEGVISANVDDLKAVVQKNTANRRKQMIEAEILLKEEMVQFMKWQQSLGAVPTILKLKEKAELLRKEEIMKSAKKLEKLTPKELETIEKITKGIVTKILRGPLTHLKDQIEGEASRNAIHQMNAAFQLGN